MSLNINTNLTNNLTGYLLDAKNVKGGFIVVSDYSALTNLPSAVIIDGVLVYCQSNITISGTEYAAGFYQYNNNAWNLANFDQNIELKTINGQSLFGEGDISVQAVVDASELIEVGEYNQTLPSNNLSAGGLFLRRA